MTKVSWSKWFLVFIALLLMIAPEVFATGTGERAGKETVKLRLFVERGLIAAALGTTQEDSANLETAKTDFIRLMKERHNIDIVIETMEKGGAEYEMQFKVVLQSGEVPDVFYTHGVGFAAPYIASKMVVPIGKYLEEFKTYDVILPSARIPNEIDGNIYALPVDPTYYNVWLYNKKIFEKYGLKPARTYKELVNLVTTLKQKDPEIIPISVPIKEGWTAAMCLEGFAYTLDNELMGKIRKGTAKFSDPPWKAAAQKIQELVKLGAYSKNYLMNDIGQADADFTKGRAAMLQCGTWSVAGAVKELGDENVDLTYFPVLDESKVSDFNRIACGGVKPDAALMVSSKCKNPRAGALLVSEFSRYIDQLFFERAGNPVSVYRTDKLGWKFAGGKSQIPVAFQTFIKDLNSFKTGTKGFSIDEVPDPAIGEVLMKQSTALWALLITPDQYCKDLDDAMEKFRAKK